MPDAASLPGGGRSCALITASGLQLALGNAPASRDCANLAGAGASAGAEQESPAQPDGSPFAKSDYFVIGAAVLILLSLLATFLLGAIGSLIAAGGSLIAACLLAYDIFMRIPQAVRAGPEGGNGPSPDQIAQIIQIQPQIGFWLVLVALLAAIALNVMASRQPSAATPPPPPAV